jgi:hypothetical protein
LRESTIGPAGLAAEGIIAAKVKGPSRFEIPLENPKAIVFRAGQRNDNDLVWIGRAPNFAAELSSIRRTALRGVLAFYNGQTQAERYLR